MNYHITKNTVQKNNIYNMNEIDTTLSIIQASQVIIDKNIDL